MHANAKLHRLNGGVAGVLGSYRRLYRDRAPDSIDRASEVATMLSPAVLKMRPRCDAINSSTMARHDFRRASVPTSSRAINRL
jgi:hypothetical protein